ncbi:MAG: TIGR02757 family protein [Bacteroidales bacterium]|jgi:uncharacterized protein (TIGR02757 family)
MSTEDINKVKDLLDYYYNFFDKKQFIETDPISIPHKFTKKEDIEIAGFFAATIAWGNRTSIIKTANNFCERLDNSPFDFITNSSEKEIYNAIKGFYYRTFKEEDALGFMHSIQNIYKNLGGLEKVFTDGYNLYETDKIKNSIIYFRNSFLKVDILERTKKHIANPSKGSAAKRINMFLRWMVRKDNNGVDFGLWNNINTKDLIIPLDVHVGNTVRKLNILNRKANDWRAAEEVTSVLRTFDENDPIKYDFALFGISNSKINI